MGRRHIDMDHVPQVSHIAVLRWNVSAWVLELQQPAVAHVGHHHPGQPEPVRLDVGGGGLPAPHHPPALVTH